MNRIINDLLDWFVEHSLLVALLIAALVGLLLFLFSRALFQR